MILSCPECSTRFMVADNLLAPDGRKVKCAKCSHVWFQEPSSEDSATDSEKPPIQDIPEGVKPIKDGSGVPAAIAQAKVIVWKRAVATFVLLLIVFLAVTIPLKNTLVAAWEPSALLFKTVGLNVPAPGEGLAIESVSFQEKESGEQAHLTVSGFLTNKTEKPVAVPALEVIVYQQENELNRFSFKPGFETLAPGESTKFDYTHEAAAPGGEMAEISLLFRH